MAIKFHLHDSPDLDTQTLEKRNMHFMKLIKTSGKCYFALVTLSLQKKIYNSV